MKKAIKFLVMRAYIRGWVSAQFVCRVFAKIGLKAH
jgi:hypothetical protein